MGLEFGIWTKKNILYKNTAVCITTTTAKLKIGNILKKQNTILLFISRTCPSCMMYDV